MSKHYAQPSLSPQLDQELQEQGYELVDGGTDGDCLFRALADQMYGDPQRHTEVRSIIVDHMKNNNTLFEGFVDDSDIHGYLESMAKSSTYGGEIEIARRSYSLFQVRVPC